MPAEMSAKAKISKSAARTWRQRKLKEISSAKLAAKKAFINVAKKSLKISEK
jgi:hypothetical protein